MGWGSGESTGGTAQPGELDAATPRATDHGRAATKNNLSLAFVGHQLLVELLYDLVQQACILQPPPEGERII